jgi:branched-subunit amino acid aminotransferase/4-amino-4-deoxychorismate lyase
LRTPPPEAGILCGITRRAVLQCARAAGMPCREAPCAPDHLSGAQEAFITNAVMGIMPLVQVDGVVLGGGRPGPLTARLMHAYAAMVARETDATCCEYPP